MKIAIITDTALPEVHPDLSEELAHLDALLDGTWTRNVKMVAGTPVQFAGQQSGSQYTEACKSRYTPEAALAGRHYRSACICGNKETK